MPAQRLAPATAAPRSAATAPAATAAAASPAAATASPLGKLHVSFQGIRRVFPVKDIERPQANVGDFVVAEENLVVRKGFCDGTSAVAPTLDAEAPPASANDTPAMPNAETAFIRCFRLLESCFLRDIVAPSVQVASHLGQPEKATGVPQHGGDEPLRVVIR
jgi:hypothetical protein